MAKARGRKASGGGRKAGGAGAEAHVLAVALDLIADGGWRKLTLEAVARKAGVAPARVRALFPGREAVLEAFFLEIDRRAAAEGTYAADDSSPVRDRLFDLLMRRFDALAPRRRAIKALIKDLPLEPETAAWCALRLARSLAWTLEAAGLSASGVSGRVRANGLLLIYLNALRVWLADESADMSPTMAALDKGLRAAESVMESLKGIFPVRRPAGKKDTKRGAGPAP